MERSWIAKIPATQRTDNPSNIYTAYRMNNQPEDARRLQYSKFKNNKPGFGFKNFAYTQG